MIDTRTGQPSPCPTCGAARVRWRKRGPRDFAATWARKLIELPFEALFTSSGRVDRMRIRGTTYGAGHSRDDLMRKRAESATGWSTPRYFWRCNACRNHGHIFRAPPSRP